MTSTHRSSRWLAWLGAAAAIGLTIALMVIVISLAPSRDDRSSQIAGALGESLTAASSPLGVHARMTVGDVSIARSLPALSFTLAPDQALDMRLPAGAFTAEFDATFRTDRSTRARFGAEVEGGSVQILWRDKVIAQSSESPLQKAAGDDADDDGGGTNAAPLVFSDSVAVPARLNTVTYRFVSDGSGPSRLRALWQPKDAQTALPLPAPGAALMDSQALRGRMLFEKLNCIACHAPQSDDLRTTIAGTPAPILGGIGSRARPPWIRAWLRNPHAVKHDASMPRLFAEDDAPSADTIENLVHFLASLGGPLIDPASKPDMGLGATGQKLFHQVGCFACHGSYIHENTIDAEIEVEGALISLGDLRSKTTAAALAEFLRDPLAVRPSGRMPSLDLNDDEATALAHYVMSLGGEAVEFESAFAVNPSRVERGRASFASLGCANCHVLGPNYAAIDSTLDTPDLESIASSISTSTLDGGMRGCLADDWHPGTPRFAFDADDRHAIAAFLEQIAQRRSTDIPHDRLASALARLNCLACHRYQDEGGPSPALLRHFTTLGEADLGDEGRLPPPLTEVGAKLNAAWLTTVLMDHGRVRPYLAVRMPHFGESARDLTSLFISACGARIDDTKNEPVFSDQFASAGRRLVGSKGLNCLQCHSVAGRLGTGTIGVDLATTVERLRYDYFNRWLHDPSQISPGTRMPTFFVDGASGMTTEFDGDASQQIDAMWSYFSQGEMLPLPEGLLDTAGLQLEVIDEPLVFRTFMKEAGLRAIACGYPQRIHCVFDAESCAIVAAWEGAFLNAAGAWAGRGGTQTNPMSMAWTTARAPIVGLCDHQTFTPATMQFDGYRLDETRRPIFLFRATMAGCDIHIEQQPIPQRDSQRASLLNRMTFHGPREMSFCINLPAGDGAGSPTALQLDKSGSARLDWEITW